MEILSLDAAIDDPEQAARYLEQELLYVAAAWGYHEVHSAGLRTVFGTSCSIRAAIVVIVRPTGRLEREYFPEESLRVRIWRHHGADRGYSIEPIRNSATRQFKHRNPDGTLCLETPSDPPARRWSWDNGLQSLILNAARHMWFEEFNRRAGRWPVEDSPHGIPMEE